MTLENADSPTRERASQATELVQARIPVVLLRHGRKIPVGGSGGTWDVVTEPEEVPNAIERASRRGVPNLGGVLAPKCDSRLVVVDQDGEEAGEKLRELGVSSRDGVWIVRTGRGNYHVYYYWPRNVPPPRRVTRAGGLPVDLLSDGYGVLPRSSTYLEPKGGGPYCWIRGHSPGDIPLSELAPTPDALLEWWSNCTRKHPLEPRPSPGKLKTHQLLSSPIAEGSRNDTLTHIAGWLRLYHPPDDLAVLLLAINDARCRPPLDDQEVRAIVRSVTRYPQPGVNGHPRAAVPRYVREEEADG